MIKLIDILSENSTKNIEELKKKLLHTYSNFEDGRVEITRIDTPTNNISRPFNIYIDIFPTKITKRTATNAIYAIAEKIKETGFENLINPIRVSGIYVSEVGEHGHNNIMKYLSRNERKVLSFDGCPINDALERIWDYTIDISHIPPITDRIKIQYEKKINRAKNVFDFLNDSTININGENVKYKMTLKKIRLTLKDNYSEKYPDGFAIEITEPSGIEYTDVTVSITTDLLYTGKSGISDITNTLFKNFQNFGIEFAFFNDVKKLSEKEWEKNFGD